MGARAVYRGLYEKASVSVTSEQRLEIFSGVRVLDLPAEQVLIFREQEGVGWRQVRGGVRPVAVPCRPRRPVRGL